MIVTGEQLRGARAMARIEQADLASKAGVSVDTIKRLERTVGAISANVATMTAIVTVLQSAGVEFTNGARPGVRLKRFRLTVGDRVKFAPSSTLRASVPDLAPNSVGEIVNVIDGMLGGAVHVDVKFPELSDPIFGIPTSDLAIAAPSAVSSSGPGLGVRLRKSK